MEDEALRVRMLGMIVALALSACANAPSAAGRQALDCAALDPIFANWSGPDTPGFSVAVFQSGEIACTRAYGSAHLDQNEPITASTRFNIASLTKSLTAFAALDIAADGLIDLDAPLSAGLPNAPHYAQAVSVRQLLAHTAGVRDIATLLGLAGGSAASPLQNSELRSIIDRQTALNFAPGTRFQYSNSGYVLAAAAMENASQSPFSEILAARVFQPAGMRNSLVYEQPGQDMANAAQSYVRAPETGDWTPMSSAVATAGSTNVYATAADMAHWGIFLLQSASRQDRRARAIITPIILNDGGVSAYGLGLEVSTYRGRRLWLHTGSEAGYRGALMMLPDLDAGVVILGNGSVRPQQLAEMVLDTFFESSFTAPSPRADVRPALASTEQDIIALSGFYGLEPGRVAQVAYFEDQWYVAVDPLGVAPFERVAPTTLLHRPSGVALDFSAPEGALYQETRLTGIGAASAGRRIAPADHRSLELSHFSGRYVSSEIQATYEVIATDAGLSVVVPGQPPLPLDALADNLFASAPAGGTITFSAPDSFLLDTWRVNNLLFTRVAPQAPNAP